jgi:hypothetical protein
LGSRLLATTLQRFTNETELRDGFLQEDQLPSFEYQLLKQNEVSAHNLTAALQRTKRMKTAIEMLKDVHQTAKVHPDIYDAIKVNDGSLVAAIVSLADQLEHFKQSKQDKISPAQVQAMSNELTRGALGTKLSRVLGNAADKGNEKDVALRIHQFLEAQ